MKKGLLELAAKVEAASGPDRELDCAIAVAAAGFFELPPRWEGGPVGYGYTNADGEQIHPGHGGDQLVKPYTASLDAAMTLVPEGYDWSLCRYAQVDEGFLPFSVNMTPEVQPYPVDQEIDVEAVTPALALTAAALRARAAQGGAS